MKYEYLMGDVDIPRKYSGLYKFFQDNEKVCKQFMNFNSTIACDFTFTGNNLLANICGVLEKLLHTDYSLPETLG